MTVKELYDQVRDGVIISDIELQREIVYNTEKQELVIDSIVNDIPLPAFYLWKKNNGILEVLDGKQRIHAITRFFENDLEYNGILWKKTKPDIQQKICNTSLAIIICEGEEEKKREIFNRINTLGVPLSPFEVINGLYNGEYLRGLTRFVEADKDAKKILGANSRGKNQMKVLDFICQLRNIKDKKEYVNNHQNDSFEIDQVKINKYFRFVSSIFTDYSQLNILLNLALKYIKDLSIWKEYKHDINKRLALFRKSQDYKLIPDKTKEIDDIIQTVVKGISVDPKRLFTIDDKQILCEEAMKDESRHNGDKILCQGDCHQYYYREELTVDHILPWSKGGRTELSNAALLCRACNSKKNNH